MEMINSRDLRKVFLAVAAAAFFTVAGCSNQATDQATNQAPAPVKKAVAKAVAPKPVSKPAAAPKQAAKQTSSAKVVAAKAPAAKPAAKPASSKVAASKATQPSNFVTVPQGTMVRATVSDALASNKNHSGDSFAAILSSSIKVDGKTVIPKGAHIAGRVVTAKKAGPAELTVVLTSVQVNGKSYKLATEPIDRTGKAPKDAGDAESAKPEKDITINAESHLKFKLAKPAKIPAQIPAQS
jgi:hypothetical protein